MSLLSNLFGQPQQMANGMNNGPLGMIQKFQQFASNPVASLMGMFPNLQIPQNLMNDPKAVVEHLLTTGQMTQEQFNQLSQTANQMQNMFPKL